MPRDFYPEPRGRRHNPNPVNYSLGPPPPPGVGRSYDPEFDARNYGQMQRSAGKMPHGPPPGSAGKMPHGPPPGSGTHGPGQRSGGKPSASSKGSRADEMYPYQGNDERSHKGGNFGLAEQLQQEPREVRRQKHKKSKHKRKHSKERAEKKMKKRANKSLVAYDDITSGSEQDEYSSMHNSPAPARVSPHIEKPQRRRHSPATALQEYRNQSLGDGSPFAASEKMLRNSSKTSKSRQPAAFQEQHKMYRAVEAPKAYVDPPKAYRTSPSRSPSPKKPRYKSRSPSPYSRRRSVSPHR